MLTNRQQDLLTDTANGLLNKEQADKHSISLRTVEEHHRKARIALKAKTTTHAVVRAIKLGLINLGEIGVVVLLALNAGYFSMSHPDFDIDMNRSSRINTVRLVRTARRKD